jgi:predicted nucleic acid-binding Zn ribbon protein
MNDPRAQTCFACGEVNSPDSRFCKFCGRPLVRPERRPSVAQDPRNRILLWLVLILLGLLAVFFVVGLLTSKVFR